MPTLQQALFGVFPLTVLQVSHLRMIWLGFGIGSYWQRSEACVGEKAKGAVMTVEVEDDGFPFFWSRSQVC